MAENEETETGKETETAEQNPVPERALKSGRQFIAEHGKPTRVVVENVGRAGARVVLIGTDGRLGDIIVDSTEIGDKLVEQLGTEAELSKWDNETVAAAKIGPTRRNSMGPSITRG